MVNGCEAGAARGREGTRGKGHNRGPEDLRIHGQERGGAARGLGGSEGRRTKGFASCFSGGFRHLMSRGVAR